MSEVAEEADCSLEEAPPVKMMEEISPPSDVSYDSLNEEYEPPAERWAPLGASLTPPPSMGEQSHMTETERLRGLEEEQEQLNNSLFALTTHFAQVQFRLKQIVGAPTDEKESLLKELEEFANKGIPDLNSYHIPSKEEEELYDDYYEYDEATEKEYDAKITEQRHKQQELIIQLKSQLEDLETYAYEMGDSDLPTSKVMEKQKVIIDQLTNKLDVPDIDNFDKLSPEELRQMVDRAVTSIVHPAKVKEKLVEQLKTQIVDLERFIDFLQGEAQSPGPLGERCTCPEHGSKGHSHEKGKVKKASATDKENAKNFRRQTLSIMRQALTVLQIFAISQFGCGGREFKKNVLKRTTKGNHWGDLRARLEITIDRVENLGREHEHSAPEESDYMSDSEDAPSILCNQELTTAVRKDLAMALKDLLQHGLMEVGQSTSLVPFGCFSARRKDTFEEDGTKMMHAWDLVLKYYEMKHGKEFNESPARKLSQSFSLEMVGGRPITAKQTLLSAIEEVRATHEPLKRSEDSMFKAFICIGLNQKKLVSWLRLILKTTSIVEYYYQPWSYVMKTGFDDALMSLDKLGKITFHLPVDLAIRPFHNIKDAF